MDEKRDEAVVKEAVGWWEKWRVILLGASLLVSIVTGTWVLSGQNTTIIDGVRALTESQRHLAASQDKLATKVDELVEKSGGHEARLGKLEALNDQQQINIQRFWDKDWAGMQARVTACEQAIINLKLAFYHGPVVKQSPPEVPRDR